MQEIWLTNLMMICWVDLPGTRIQVEAPWECPAQLLSLEVLLEAWSYERNRKHYISETRLNKDDKICNTDEKVHEYVILNVGILPCLSVLTWVVEWRVLELKCWEEKTILKPNHKSCISNAILSFWQMWMSKPVTIVQVKKPTQIRY
jgi:hypothetical protein